MTASTAKSLHKLLADSTGVEYRDTEGSSVWLPSAVQRNPGDVARLNELVGYEKYREVAS